MPNRSQQAKNQADHLDLNSERRKNACRDMQGAGRWALSIPHQHYPNKAWPLCHCWFCLVSKFPELNCGDAQIEKQAWLKFIKSDLSIPYRVQDKI